MSNEQITIGVYRDLTNRGLGEPDDGPLAQQAHKKRRKALEEDLGVSGLRVLAWGDTKDQRPHENVQLVIEFVSSPAVQTGALAALTFIGGTISKACSSVVADGLKYVIGKLIARMRSKEIENFSIQAPGGVSINVHQNFSGTITVSGQTFDFQADR